MMMRKTPMFRYDTEERCPFSGEPCNKRTYKDRLSDISILMYTSIAALLAIIGLIMYLLYQTGGPYVVPIT